MADKRIADFATLEEAQDDDLLLVSSEDETYNMKFGTFKEAVRGDADRAAAAAEAAKAAAQLATGVSDEALKAQFKLQCDNVIRVLERFLETGEI